MKKYVFMLMTCFLGFSLSAHAAGMQGIWEKYSSMSQESPSPAAPAAPAAGFPGRIIGELDQEHKAYFTQNWKGRALSYELYFASSEELAKSVYDLALFAKDIDESLAKDKFYRGVLGFHYNKGQVLAWAKSLYKSGMTAKDYPYLLQLLLEDKVLILDAEGFTFAEGIHHVLAASAGKKRTFASTLEHERLHVLWDEDTTLREKQIAKWHALSDAEKSQVRKDLHQYAQDNEAQLIEEWSVHSTERAHFQLF